MDECRSLASEDELLENGSRKGSSAGTAVFNHKKTAVQLEWERQAATRGTERTLLAQAVSNLLLLHRVKCLLIDCSIYFFFYT